MDDADRVTELQEVEEALLLKYPAPAEIQATGFCHYCGEAVEKPKKFCDGECAAEWEREKKLRRR